MPDRADTVTVVPTPLGRTDLHLAALHGDDDAAREAIGAGGDVNAVDGKLGWSPLHFAADNGAVGVARLLLDNGADVDARGKDGQTPLWRAVMSGAKASDGTLVRLLVEAGADPDAADQKGKTPRSMAELLAAADPAWLTR